MSTQEIQAKAKQLMKKAGLTYQEVGERMGYAPESARQSASQVLNGENPTVKSVARLAKAIGVSMRELL